MQLEQNVGPQAAIVAIDNPTGEIKAMVGGYSFDESKFNRATQAQRQVGSSFKIYVYSAAIEQGFTPFDTILDAPFTTMSGGQPYSPHNYDEKFEGVITLRRALDGSRNVPAVKLAEKVGMNSVIDMARRFGITSPLPPYLPITLGAADLNLLEHTSAFTVFPDDGIRIDPHMIRRVTTYDGALLEQAHPARSRRRGTGRGAHHDGDARGRRRARHRNARARPGPPRRRQDRHDQRFHRRLVHRLHSGNHRGRVGRLRR